MSSLEIKDNILHVPQLSEDERDEFIDIKLPNNLQELYCNSRQLKELPELPHLKILECSRNRLEELPELPDSLEVLICDNNYYESQNAKGRVEFIRTLSELPELPKSLKVLICNANLIKHIPTLPYTLKELNCSSNLLTEVPILPKSLKMFECYNATLKEPYNELVRIAKMNDRINSIRLYQLADIGSKLDQLDRFSSLADDIKTSISTIISGESKSLPYMREYINKEIADLLSKLGNKRNKVIRLLEKIKHNTKQNDETRIRNKITNRNYYANTENSNSAQNARSTRRHRSHRSNRSNRSTKSHRSARSNRSTKSHRSARSNRSIRSIRTAKK